MNPVKIQVVLSTAPQDRIRAAPRVCDRQRIGPSRELPGWRTQLADRIPGKCNIVSVQFDPMPFRPTARRWPESLLLSSMAVLSGLA